MEKLLNYLSEANTAAEIYKQNIEERINICIGNVSCDMDSAIGAILLAYYMSHKDDYFSDPGNFDNFWIPVINCPRNEIVARLDIASHLKLSGIDTEKLVYIDDLDINFYSSKGLLRLSLIDHNKLDITQESWAKSVVYLVDHHVDLKEYPDLDKVLQFCGSACSLAMNLIFQSDFAEQILTKEICQFFSAAILIDTENLKPNLKGTKWSDDDVSAILEISRICNKKYYDELISKKTDRQLNIGLGLELMLRKDYKNYQWKNCVAGISVIFNTFHEVMNSFGVEELRKTINKRLETNKLNFYAIITQTYSKTGEAMREIMLFDEDSNRLTKISEAFEKTSPYAIVRKKFTGYSKCFAFYMFKDSSVSRKKVEPVLRDIFGTL
jgi:inorganic pyrophosphatase/exopolyphosphatase